MYLVFFIWAVSPLQMSQDFQHGGEARDLLLKIPGTLPTVRICISLIFSLIMVGFAWFFCRQFKKGTKTTYINGFLEK